MAWKCYLSKSDSMAWKYYLSKSTEKINFFQKRTSETKYNFFNQHDNCQPTCTIRVNTKYSIFCDEENRKLQLWVNTQPQVGGAWRQVNSCQSRAHAKSTSHSLHSPADGWSGPQLRALRNMIFKK